VILIILLLYLFIEAVAYFCMVIYWDRYQIQNYVSIKEV